MNMSGFKQGKSLKNVVFKNYPNKFVAGFTDDKPRRDFKVSRTGAITLGRRTDLKNSDVVGFLEAGDRKVFSKPINDKNMITKLIDIMLKNGTQTMDNRFKNMAISLFTKPMLTKKYRRESDLTIKRKGGVSKPTIFSGQLLKSVKAFIMGKKK